MLELLDLRADICFWNAPHLLLAWQDTDGCLSNNGSADCKLWNNRNFFSILFYFLILFLLLQYSLMKLIQFNDSLVSPVDTDVTRELVATVLSVNPCATSCLQLKRSDLILLLHWKTMNCICSTKEMICVYFYELFKEDIYLSGGISHLVLLRILSVVFRVQ